MHAESDRIQLRLYVCMYVYVYEQFQAYCVEVCQTQHQALGLSLVIISSTTELFIV